MNKNDAKNYKLRVGYTVFIGLVIFFVFIILVGTEGYYFSKTYQLKILLKDSQGLIEGSKVYLGGLKVGRIDNIEFTNVNDENLVLIKFSVLQKYSHQITNNSFATVETSGLIGDKQINISLGSPSDTPLTENNYIPVKETISLESLSGRIEPIVENVNTITANLKTFTDTINKGDGSLGKMILGSETSNKLNSVLQKLNTFAVKINERNSTLGKLINNDDFYNNLSSLTSDLKLIAENIKIGKGTLGKLAVNDSLYNNINNVSGQLNGMLQKTQNDSTVIGGLLGDKKLYRDINNLIEELNKLIVDIREHPGKYIKVSVF